MDFDFSDSVAIIVALLVSIIAPVILSVLTGRQAHRAKLDDWGRQDQVAAQAAEAAALLLEKQNEQAAKAVEAAALLLQKQEEQAVKVEETARKLLAAQHETIRRTDEVAAAAAADGHGIQVQLKQIHYLVNSEMTAARQAELDALKIALTLLHRVMHLDQDHGLAVNVEDLQAVHIKEDRIEELQGILDSRHAQQAVIQEEMSDAAKDESRPS